MLLDHSFRRISSEWNSFFFFFRLTVPIHPHTLCHTHITTPLIFPFSFIFIVRQFLYTISPLSWAELVDSHSSVWSLPACRCPLTGCRVVEGLLTEAGICFLLSVAIQVCLISADCFLGCSCLAAGLCELHFGAITHVSVGTNCLRSLSLPVWQSLWDLGFESEHIGQASLSTTVSFSLSFSSCLAVSVCL